MISANLLYFSIYVHQYALRLSYSIYFQIFNGVRTGKILQ